MKVTIQLARLKRGFTVDLSQARDAVLDLEEAAAQLKADLGLEGSEDATEGK